MKKTLILLICFCLILAFSSVCFALGTYPLGVMTKEQIIEKYFKGRTLDPIEGFWEYGPNEQRWIVSTSVLDKEKEKYADVDFLLLGFNEKSSDVSLFGKLRKTSTPYLYKDYRNFMIISPMAMVDELNKDYPHRFLIRTYPQVALKVTDN